MCLQKHICPMYLTSGTFFLLNRVSNVFFAFRRNLFPILKPQSYSWSCDLADPSCKLCWSVSLSVLIKEHWQTRIIRVFMNVLNIIIMNIKSMVWLMDWHSSMRFIMTWFGQYGAASRRQGSPVKYGAAFPRTKSDHASSSHLVVFLSLIIPQKDKSLLISDNPQKDKSLNISKLTLGFNFTSIPKHQAGNNPTQMNFPLIFIPPKNY